MTSCTCLPVADNVRSALEGKAIASCPAHHTLGHEPATQEVLALNSEALTDSICRAIGATTIEGDIQP